MKLQGHSGRHKNRLSDPAGENPAAKTDAFGPTFILLVREDMHSDISDTSLLLGH